MQNMDAIRPPSLPISAIILIDELLSEALSRGALEDILDDLPTVDGVIEDFGSVYTPFRTNGQALWT